MFIFLGLELTIIISNLGNGAWTVSKHTWPSDPAYFGHRFSNGPVWVEYLAKRLGMELDDGAVGGGGFTLRLDLDSFCV